MQFQFEALNEKSIQDLIKNRGFESRTGAYFFDASKPISMKMKQAIWNYRTKIILSTEIAQTDIAQDEPISDDIQYYKIPDSWIQTYDTQYQPTGALGAILEPFREAIKSDTGQDINTDQESLSELIDIVRFHAALYEYKQKHLDFNLERETKYPTLYSIRTSFYKQSASLLAKGRDNAQYYTRAAFYTVYQPVTKHLFLRKMEDLQKKEAENEETINESMVRLFTGLFDLYQQDKVLVTSRLESVERKNITKESEKILMEFKEQYRWSPDLIKQVIQLSVLANNTRSPIFDEEKAEREELLSQFKEKTEYEQIRTSFTSLVSNYVTAMKKNYKSGSKEAKALDTFLSEAHEKIKEISKSNFMNPSCYRTTLAAELKTCGAKHFSRTSASLRVFADVLMCVFFPIGLVVAAARHANTGNSFFYIGQKEATRRQARLESDLDSTVENKGPAPL